MKRSVVVLLLSVCCIYANVLFIGDAEDTLKCNSKEFHPVSLLECDQLEAITDINICYYRNASLGCKKLFKGEIYPLDKLSANSLNFTRLLSFHTNEKTSFGIKRFGNQTKEIGMPCGTIIKPLNDLNVKLDKVYNIRLQLSVDRHTLIKSDYIGDSIHIAPKYFEPSKKYSWNITLDGVTYKGDFDILDQDTENEMKDEITRLIQDIDDKASKELIKSIVYDEYGLMYDREQTLKGMK